MGIEKAVWSFRNEKTEQQVDGLSFKQASFVFNLIPSKSRYLWLVWHEGLTDWMTLDECTHFKSDQPEEKAETPAAPRPELTKTVKASSKAAPASKGKTKEKTNTGITNTVRTRPGPDPDDNRRFTRRFLKHFKVTIDINGKAFMTHTLNLSMGGMLLEHPMPLDGTLKSFPVRLERHDGAKVDLFCSMIRVPNGLNSKRLRIIGVKQEGLFRSWLLDPSLG